jgi:hypothetical protein
MIICTVGGMMDWFGISGTMFSPQRKTQPPYQGFVDSYGVITSFALESKPVHPSRSPIYLTTSLENRPLAVTPQINEKLGKCTESASKSNIRRRK